MTIASFTLCFARNKTRGEYEKMRKWKEVEEFRAIGETNHHLFTTQELKNYQSDNKNMLIGVECTEK